MSTEEEFFAPRFHGPGPGLNVFAYTGRCELATEALAEQWIAWMRESHLADVVAAGATGATLVRLDGTPSVCEARYLFDSRAAFERYERDQAPRLRTEGLAAFPLERGLRHTRTTGERVARVAGPAAR